MSIKKGQTCWEVNLLGNRGRRLLSLYQWYKTYCPD